MTEDQALQLIDISSQILDKLDWVQCVASWCAFIGGVLIPLVLVIALLWWFVRQFIERYY